jgi:uncharacterized membrane protein HdeD (DUF308 family)
LERFGPFVVLALSQTALSGTLGAVLFVAGSFELVSAFDRTGVERWMLLIGGPFTLFLSAICLTGFFNMLGKARG